MRTNEVDLPVPFKDIVEVFITHFAHMPNIQAEILVIEKAVEVGLKAEATHEKFVRVLIDMEEKTEALSKADFDEVHREWVKRADPETMRIYRQLTGHA